MDDRTSLELLAGRFEFEAHSALHDSPLYGRIGQAVARRPDVLQLMLAAPEEQRVPVLLFAAAHYLLLGEPGHPLARHYPNLAAGPAAGDPAEAFASFCIDHADELQQVMATKSTQTNEIGRSVVLEPAYAAAEMVASRPIGLVEVGTSGGLNLRFDRYRLEYGDHVVRGDARSPISLRTASRQPLDALARLPPAEVPWRVGIDREPIDVADPDQARWLMACVWPDQPERFERLAAAIGQMVADPRPPPVRKGVVPDDVAEAVREVPPDIEPCVAASWVLNYLDTPGRVALVEALDAASHRRPVSLIYAESPLLIDGIPLPDRPDDFDERFTALCHLRWDHGSLEARWLASCHPHGRWIRWHDIG